MTGPSPALSPWGHLHVFITLVGWWFSWERAVTPALSTCDCPSLGEVTECQGLDNKPTDTDLTHWGSSLGIGGLET